MASTNPFDEIPSGTPSPLPVRHAKEKVEPIKPSKSIEEIADILLQEKLVLTALELHSELLESGKELSNLRDYFSNPGNFDHALPQALMVVKSEIVRTPSMSTFDSLELGRYSDDGRDADERVAVLEFELRKAYDTIKSLRGSLTRASDITNEGEDVRKTNTNKQEPIKPHEKRALNYLVHEYLNETNSKLTAITLSEENGDQNFEDWDDVGLNIPKPPQLLQQLRHYNSFSLGGQEQMNRIRHLEAEVTDLNSQILALKRENESLNLRLRKQSIVSSHSDDDLQTMGGSVRMRGYSDSYRKAFTPDVSRTRTVLHGRNRSGEDSRIFHLEGSPIKTTVPYSPSSNKSFGFNEQTTPPKNGSIISDESPILSKKSTSVFENQPETPDSVSNVMDSINTDMTDDVNDLREEEQEEVLNEEREDVKIEKPTLSESDSTIVDSKSPDVVFSDVKRHMSVEFRRELLSNIRLKTDSKIGLEISRLADPDLNIVELLGRCLPDVVKNVILAKREELIPLLLCVISRHSDYKERDKLLKILFNLIKRPDESQRQMIMSGCIAFTKLNGEVEAELFPQIWEQIDNKYYERRLLVAESCGVLIPHIPPSLRGSLVLSVLTQMLQSDKGESVREAAVKSLGILVAFTDDINKFKQCWELLLTGLNDSSKLVTTTTHTVLLPALAAWAHELDKLESDIIIYFLKQLHICVKQVSLSEGESGATERCQQHIVTLTHLVPWHFASILLSGPYSDDSQDGEFHKLSFPRPYSRLLDIRVIIGDNSHLSALMSGLDKEMSQDNIIKWSKLTWFHDECLTSLLKSIETLGFTQRELLHTLSTLISEYCMYFGYLFTNKIIKPFFQSSLDVPGEKTVLGPSDTPLASTVFPVFVSGVLTCFKQDEPQLTSYLKDTIVDLSLSYTPLDSLKATIILLKRERKYHLLLVRILQELASHSAVQVRCCVATLLGLMISGVDEKLLNNHVIKTLLQLAADSEMSVKIHTVESLGVIMETISKREILNQVHKQFQSFADNIKYDFLLYETILHTLARIVHNADPVFRDEFIIPLLAELSLQNNEAPNLTQRKDIAHMLLEAYRGVSGCFVSMELISEYIIPGLRALQEDFEVVDKNSVPAIKQLLQDSTNKLTNFQRQSRSDSMLKDQSLLSRFTTPKMSFSFKKKN